MEEQKPIDIVKSPPSGAAGTAGSKKIVVDDPTLLGQILSEKYKLIMEVGRGGMGTVYKAEHLQLNKLQAVKVMHRHLTEESQNLRRFQNEARAASALRHDNLLTVTDYGLTDTKQPYIVMDFVEGKSLADHIKEKGKLNVSECMPIFDQVAKGLSHAHENGIIHRDLKPSNIIIGSGAEHTARIVDFGIAKIFRPDEGVAQHLTQTGEIFGSPLYMSPEQCRGGEIDARSDIYSFGCVLFEALTGNPPVKETTAVATLFKHLTGTIASISEQYPELKIPPTLEAIVCRCLENDPEKRYQSAKELREDLLRVDANETYFPPKQKKSKKQNPPTFANTTRILGFVCLTLLLGAPVIYDTLRRELESEKHKQFNYTETANALASAEGLVAQAWKKSDENDRETWKAHNPNDPAAPIPLAKRALSIKQELPQSPRVQQSVAESLNQVAFLSVKKVSVDDKRDPASGQPSVDQGIDPAVAAEYEKMYKQAIAIAPDQYLYLLTEGKSLYRSNLAQLYIKEQKYRDAEQILMQILNSIDAKTIHGIGDLNAKDSGQAKLLTQFADVYWQTGREVDAAKIDVVLQYPLEKYNKLEPKPSFANNWSEETDHPSVDGLEDQQFGIEMKNDGTGKLKVSIDAASGQRGPFEEAHDATGSYKGALGQIHWIGTVGYNPGGGDEPSSSSDVEDEKNTATIVRVGDYVVWKITQSNFETICPAQAVLTKDAKPKD